MTTDVPGEFVLIARIRKPHGLTGELEIEPFTWDENRFSKLGRVFLKLKGGEMTERHVASAQQVHKGILLKFEGIDHRTGADALRGAEIFIPEAERAKLPKDRAYYDELIGMTVIDETTGKAIGTVRNVLDMPAGDVFVLDLDGTERLVSNAGEEVVSFDTKKKELRVQLLDEY